MFCSKFDTNMAPILWTILNKPEAYNFVETKALAQVFSCEFFEMFKNNFFIEYLGMAVSKPVT